MGCSFIYLFIVILLLLGFFWGFFKKFFTKTAVVLFVLCSLFYLLMVVKHLGHSLSHPIATFCFDANIVVDNKYVECVVK